MPTGFYGLDHPNPNGIRNPDGRYHGYMTRKAKIRVVVIHTPEVLEDFTGPDGSAEAVAKYFATTDRSASAHVNIDSDSIVPFLPADHVAFHVRNYNSIGYGVELGWRATSWGKRPDLDEKIINLTAKHLAPKMKAWGIPAKFITKGLVDSGHYGLTSHAQLDPTRRTDPGAKFPWSALVTAITLEQMMERLTDDEIKFLKAMIAGLLAIGSNPSFAPVLVKDYRDRQDG